MIFEKKNRRLAVLGLLATLTLSALAQAQQVTLKVLDPERSPGRGGDTAHSLKRLLNMTGVISIPHFSNPPILEANPNLLAELFEMTTSVVGYAADGVTTVLVAAKTPESGCVDFFVQDENLATSSAPIASVGHLRDALDPHRGGQSKLRIDTVHVKYKTPAGQMIEGDYAFALLTAPMDFSRTDEDHLAKRRPVRIEADFRKKLHCFSSTSGPDSIQYWHGEIVRPPLILVHGITSSPANFKWNEIYDHDVSNAWGASMPIAEVFDDSSSLFDVLLRVDYDLPTNITRSGPFAINLYKPGPYRYERKNSQSFFENRDVSYRLGVKPAIEKLRNMGFAATQVDAVGHSMGGVLLRIYAENGHHYDEPSGTSSGGDAIFDYRRVDNWSKGDFHKLITIASPHFGSSYWEIFSAFLEDPPWYAALQIAAIRSGLIGIGLYDGGLEDMSISHPETMREAIVPCFAIVGASAQAIFSNSPLLQAWAKMKRDTGDFVGYVPILPESYLDAIFAPFKFTPNDTAVHVASAAGGLPANNCQILTSPFWEVIHSSMGYHSELNPITHVPIGYVGQGSSPVIATKVFDLLNEKIKDPATVFAPKFPAHSGYSGLSSGGSSAGSSPAALEAVSRPLTLNALEIVDPIPGATIPAGSAPTISIATLQGFDCNSFAVGSEDGIAYSGNGLGNCSGAPEICSIPLSIPLSAIGSRKIYAFGEGHTANGVPALAYSKQVTITVVPPPGATLNGIRMQPEAIDLFSSNPKVHTELFGRFSDIDRDISSLPGIVFSTIDPSVATVDAEGIVRGKAIGVTNLSVQYSGYQILVPVKVFSIQGDRDGNGVIDSADFGHFATCFSTEEAPPGNECQAIFDFDGDLDIDLEDFAAFKLVWTGPGIPDCNGNGQDDRDEILTGQVTDCDRNGIPDGCGNNDCDANGTPDVCEITPKNFGFEDATSHTSSYATPSAVAMGDFDGNGIEDIAIASGEQISLLLGQPVGSFHFPYYSSTGNTLPVGSNVVALAAANLDSNSLNEELVAVSATSTGFGSVSILRGCSPSNGVFAHVQIAPLTTAPSGVSPKAVAIGDFNSDNRLDIAVVKSNATSFGEVDILWNLGATPGIFKIPQNVTDDFHTQADASGIACGDFNRDGRIDLAVSNKIANSVVIIQNAGENGSGAFLNPNAARTFDASDNVVLDLPVAIATGDMTGDGWPEIAVVEKISGAVHVLVNDGQNDSNGNPQFDLVYGVARVASQATSMLSADFNGDGRVDLAISGSASPYVSVLTMNPLGCRFWGNGVATRLDLADFASIHALAVGQIDESGGPDLVTVNARRVEYPGDPDASANVSIFRNRTILPAKQDRDGNGRPDSCDDLNHNQILDTCDIKNGSLHDCNGNLVPDGIELANHPELDCNNNGQLDSCDIAGSSVYASSAQMGPVYYGQNHTALIVGSASAGLNPAAPGSNVNVKFTASAPFDHAFGQPPHINDDRLLVVLRKINPPPSSPSMSMYAFSGVPYNGCGAQDSWTVNLTATQFNDWLAYSPEGKPRIEIYPQSGMTADCACAASWVKVEITYGQPGSVDLNQNGIPDECEGG